MKRRTIQCLALATIGIAFTGGGDFAVDATKGGRPDAAKVAAKQSMVQRDATHNRTAIVLISGFWRFRGTLTRLTPHLPHFFILFHEK